MAFEVGQRVGDYEIVQLLGVGGMGHVYRVRNVISDRTEAMKVLLPDLTAERDLAIRFISEIRTLASFDHPNIALLHTAFQADNQLIMMMEFVEGYTLEQRAKQGPMTIAEVTGYTGQALSALSYAHNRGVVHRDIKPANIMLTSHGVVKLMDFGIAKSNVETNLTRPGTTIGSLYYMSPEQVRGDTVDGRSDLYSVGIMLYELLAGRRPFEADTTFSILNQQLNTPPQPPIELNPSLPTALNDIILKALAKDPNQRFQDADAFRDVLRPFSTGQSAPTAAVAAPAAVAGGAASATSVVSGSAPPPAFADVPASSAPPPPPPVAAPRPIAASSSFPPAAPAPQRSHKALWIATGIAAAVLAMVGLAIGVPHLLKTHAAESAETSPPANTPSQSVAPAATPDNPPASQSTSPDATPPATQESSPSTQQPAISASTSRSPGQPARIPYAGPHPTSGSNPTAMVAETRPTSNAGASAAELEQQQDRFTEISARASSVDSGLTRLRQQQAADGLGLRHDMEAADIRMQSYLRASDQDLRSSNAAAAQRNINRAEAELNTLEKFLGK